MPGMADGPKCRTGHLWAISAVWPRPADDANVVVRFLYTVVNALGFNAGKAQNADDAAASRRL